MRLAVPTAVAHRIENVRVDDERLTRALGWLSIGLGAPQVVAPRAFDWVVGVRPGVRNRVLTRAVGIREIATGTGILSRPNAVEFVWARVAGDVMDIGMLLSAMASRRAHRVRLATSLLAVFGVTTTDLFAAVRTGRSTGRVAPDGALRTKASITVNRPVDDVYAFWHDFANLPTFMYHLDFVEMTSDTRSRWTAKGPGDMHVEWEAETVVDIPDQLLAWGSVDGTGVENSGSVHFSTAPAGQGTEVSVELEYKPPAGTLGVAVAAMLGEAPGRQLRDDLRRFKQVMETGDVMRSDASPGGTAMPQQMFQREAQPLP